MTHAAHTLCTTKSTKIHRMVLNVMLTACLSAMVGVAEARKGGADTPRDALVAGEILVQLQSTAALGSLLTKYQLTLASQFGARPIYRLKVVGAADADAIIDALALEPTVLNAEPNALHQSPEARQAVGWAIGTPSAYTTQWAPQAMRLAQAHTISLGTGVRVAVLDTGLDGSHPAFAGKLLRGFDFVDNDLDASEVGNPATSLSFGHGTHVAGLVAMVAPGAKIMPLRVLDANGMGNAWVLAEAILHAVDPDRNPATDDGVHVINLSLGSTRRTEILDTIGRLASCAIPAVVLLPTDPYADPGYNSDRDRCNALGGAVVVAAAGNDGSDAQRQYPAAEGFYGLLSVGASASNGRLASFSNFGSKVDVAAPGEGITSTLPDGAYGTWSGTSMAAPLAAGAAALVRALHPTLSARDVARRLTSFSAPLCGTDRRQIDAAAALTNTLPATANCR
jgi:subtilisin family serine protease